MRGYNCIRNTANKEHADNVEGVAWLEGCAHFQPEGCSMNIFSLRYYDFFGQAIGSNVTTQVALRQTQRRAKGCGVWGWAPDGAGAWDRAVILESCGTLLLKTNFQRSSCW